MRRFDLLLFAAALCCLLFMQPVKAMLSTSTFPDEAAVQIRQAIARRLESEMSPENARRYDSRESLAAKKAFSAIKQVPDASFEPADNAEVIAAGAQLKRHHIAALSVAFGCMAAVLAALAWLTRKTRRSRERDRIAALRSIRPALAELEQVDDPERPKTRAISLQEIWAKRAETLAKIKFEKPDGCSTPTPV